jgi:hypothetical protein
VGRKKISDADKLILRLSLEATEREVAQYFKNMRHDIEFNRPEGGFQHCIAIREAVSGLLREFFKHT